MFLFVDRGSNFMSDDFHYRRCIDPVLNSVQCSRCNSRHFRVALCKSSQRLRSQVQHISVSRSNVIHRVWCSSRNKDVAAPKLQATRRGGGRGGRKEGVKPTLSESEEMDELEKKRLLNLEKQVKIQLTTSASEKVDKLAENLEDHSRPETIVAQRVQDANFTDIQRMRSASSSTCESTMSELEKVAEQEKERILKGKQVAHLLTTSESEEENLEDQHWPQTEFDQLLQYVNSTELQTPLLPASSSTGESTPPCQWLLDRHPKLWLKMKSDWNELYDCFLCIPNIIDTLISPSGGLDVSAYRDLQGGSPVAYLIFNSGGICSRPQILWTGNDLHFVMKYIMVRWSCRDHKSVYSYEHNMWPNEGKFSAPLDDNLEMKTWEGVRMLMSIADIVNTFEQRDEFSVLFDPVSILAVNAPLFVNKVSWFRSICPYLRKLRYRIRLTLSDMIRGNITPTQPSEVELTDMGDDVTNLTSDPQP